MPATPAPVVGDPSNMTNEQRVANARYAHDIRFPKSIEEALIDVTDAITHPGIAVTPTNELMLDMLQLLARLKHS